MAKITITSGNTTITIETDEAAQVTTDDQPVVAVEPVVEITEPEPEPEPEITEVEPEPEVVEPEVKTFTTTITEKLAAELEAEQDVVAQAESVVSEVEPSDYENELLILLSEITKLESLAAKAIDSGEEEERQSVGMEVHRKMKQAANAFTGLKAKPEADFHAEQLDEIKDRIKSTSRRLVDEVFKIQGDAAA